MEQQNNNNPNPSAAGTANAASAAAFVTFPTQSGTLRVRPETIDAVESIDTHSCHLVIDGLRLPVSLDAIEAFKLVAPGS